MWVAYPVEPRAVIEARALNNQRVTVPVPYRVPQPRWVRIFGELPPVHEDLPIDHAAFVEYRHHAGGLNNPVMRDASCGQNLQGTAGEAARDRVAFMELREMLLEEGFRLRSEDSLVLHVLYHVKIVRVEFGPPKPGQVWFPIRRPRCRSRKVRLTVDGPGNLGRAEVESLTVQRKRQEPYCCHDRNSLHENCSSPPWACRVSGCRMRNIIRQRITRARGPQRLPTHDLGHARPRDRMKGATRTLSRSWMAWSFAVLTKYGQLMTVCCDLVSRAGRGESPESNRLSGSLRERCTHLKRSSWRDPCRRPDRLVEWHIRCTMKGNVADWAH
jgi:hypothetical protein